MLLEQDEKTHWVWVKSFSKLCADLTKRAHHQFHCMRCLTPHNTQENLEKHLTYCNDHEAARAVLPEPGSKLKFTNIHKRMKVPYISVEQIKECL